MNWDWGSFAGGTLGGILTLGGVLLSIRHANKISKQEAKAKKIGRLKYLQSVFENVREAEYENVLGFIHHVLESFSFIESNYPYPSKYIYDGYDFIDADLVLDKDDLLILSEISCIDELNKLKNLLILKKQFIEEEFKLAHTENHYPAFHEKKFVRFPKKENFYTALSDDIKEILKKEITPRKFEELCQLDLDSWHFISGRVLVPSELMLEILKEREVNFITNISEELFDAILNSEKFVHIDCLKIICEIILYKHDYISNIIFQEISLENETELKNLKKIILTYMDNSNDGESILNILDNITQKISEEIKKLEK
ncbi:MAG: hypothetical protein ACRCSK_08700 [Fusobacteriaceae bacterium]